MELQSIYSLVMTLAALSVASERLVEIVKSFIPYLVEKKDDPRAESLRKSAIQLLAVVAGMLTAYFSSDMLPDLHNPHDAKVLEKGVWFYVLFGLLISAGSSFWNAILTYLVKIKDIKQAKSKAMSMIVAPSVGMGYLQLPRNEKNADKALTETPAVASVHGVISIEV